MIYLLTFLEGIASFISPCVLPMLPIYLSYFAGKQSNKTKALGNSIAFVLGFSFVFVLLAILANKVGNTLTLFTKYIKMIFGSMIILLGLNYLEIFHLHFFEKSHSFQANVKNLDFVKSFIFGTLFSISMTPCVGTFLSSALLLVASEESMSKGIFLICLYCLGLGFPFVLSSILIEKLKNVFEWVKNHFKVMKVVSGIILILMGIYTIVIGR